MAPIRHFLLAVQFFTRIPVTGRLAQWVGYSPALLRASAAHFPGVGWLVAVVVCVVYALFFIALPDNAVTPLAAAVTCTIATVLLTGGFHEDGLADVAADPQATRTAAARLAAALLAHADVSSSTLQGCEQFAK